MAVIAADLTLAAGATDVLTLEIGRAWLTKITVFTEADIEFRLTNQGNSVCPVPMRGGSVFMRAYDTLYLDLNKELGGPPWEVVIEGHNSGASEKTLHMILEGYPTPYPRVKLKEKEGYSLIPTGKNNNEKEE